MVEATLNVPTALGKNTPTPLNENKENLAFCHLSAPTSPVFLSIVMLAALLALAAAATTPEGLAWLDENKNKAGVVVLPSGLQYKVLKEAPAGAKSPLVGTPCSCHYRGTLIDGTEFDSSYKRGQPTTFAPNQVIKGWTEAMQLMGEGDKWELYVPSELAYGDRQRGQHITPGAVLVFEIEILEVKGDSKPKAAA